MNSAASIVIALFAASYFAAWLFELAKLWGRASRARLALGVAMFGLVAQGLFLGDRAVRVAGPPLSSSFDWCLLAAWMLAAVTVYLAWRDPRSGMGLFLWPLVLGLTAAASGFADPAPIAAEPASKIWGAIHGVFLLLGTVVVMLGFTAGVMYLVQARRLKRHRLGVGGLKLPSLEWLEQVNSRVVFLSAVLVSIGFAAGLVLNRVGGRTVLPWTDPVVWSSGLMLGWLVAAAAFNVFYKPARHGRKVAYLTVASFLFLMIALGVFLLIDTRHGGQRPEHKSAMALATGRGEIASEEAG